MLVLKKFVVFYPPIAYTGYLQQLMKIKMDILLMVK